MYIYIYIYIYIFFIAKVNRVYSIHLDYSYNRLLILRHIMTIYRYKKVLILRHIVTIYNYIIGYYSSYYFNIQMLQNGFFERISNFDKRVQYLRSDRQKAI